MKGEGEGQFWVFEASIFESVYLLYKRYDLINVIYQINKYMVLPSIVRSLIAKCIVFLYFGLPETHKYYSNNLKRAFAYLFIVKYPIDMFKINI